MLGGTEKPILPHPRSAEYARARKKQIPIILMMPVCFLALACGLSLMAGGYKTSKQASTPEPVQDGPYGALQASKEWIRPTDPKVLEALEKWQDEKIGILMHWGLYSEWGITESWSLVTTRHSWNPRPPQYAHLTDSEYEKVYENLIKTFDPVKFDPDKWAKAFKAAGVKYVLAMTKHHDGFCMWDTKQTDYKITSPLCPFHNDPRADTVKEICNAVRKEGLSAGLYFSKADWHCPYYWLPQLGPGSGQGPNYDPTEDPADWQKFKDFTWNQIRELMSGYGRLDILWLDGGAVRPPRCGIDMNGLAAMARTYQPGLIVVDRTVPGPNENYITPEGQIPDHYLPYPWETCMPMGTAWPWKPHDHFKSVGTLLRNLCHIVAQGGNYLIGIGPDAHGQFDPVVYERLAGMGKWLKTNGEAIYSTRPAYPYEDGNCVFTRKKDGTIYAIVLSKEDGDSLPATITLPAEIADRAKGADLLGYGKLTIGVGGTIAFPDSMREKSKGGDAWAIKLETAE